MNRWSLAILSGWMVSDRTAENSLSMWGSSNPSALFAYVLAIGWGAWTALVVLDYYRYRPKP